MNNEFNCQEDGISELNNLVAKWKYHKINEVNVMEVNKGYRPDFYDIHAK